MRGLRAAFDASLPMRFVIVGGLNTAVSFGIYAGLVLAGMHYATANLMALVAGIGISYLSNGAVVFRHLGPASFARYVAMWACVYLVQVALIRAIVGVVGPVGPLGLPPELLGGFAALCVAVPLSFVLQRSFVFRGGGGSGRGPGGRPGQ